MAGLLTSDDPKARLSANLTLDYALRRHAITTLIAMAPELKSYAEAKGAGLPPNVRAARAGEFASIFVESGYKSVLKALEPANRENLPQGGVDALFLALATNDPIGILFLKGFAEQGDDELKAKAIETLQLVTFVPTT